MMSYKCKIIFEIQVTHITEYLIQKGVKKIWILINVTSILHVLAQNYLPLGLGS